MARRVVRMGLWLRDLNLFQSGIQSADVIRNERWSTRILFISFVTLLVSFLVFGGLEKQTIIVNIENPSFATFQSLQKDYSDTLKCPCSRVAVTYETFIQVEPVFHQVITFIEFF